jgi:hypothetical protein
MIFSLLAARRPRARKWRTSTPDIVEAVSAMPMMESVGGILMVYIRYIVSDGIRLRGETGNLYCVELHR